MSDGQTHYYGDGCTTHPQEPDYFDAHSGQAQNPAAPAPEKDVSGPPAPPPPPDPSVRWNPRQIERFDLLLVSNALLDLRNHFQALDQVNAGITGVAFESPLTRTVVKALDHLDALGTAAGQGPAEAFLNEHQVRIEWRPSKAPLRSMEMHIDCSLCGTRDEIDSDYYDWHVQVWKRYDQLPAGWEP